MVQRPAARRQQVVDDAEVGTQILQPHVLEHADAADAVERALHVAVVLQANFDAVLQPGGPHAFGRQFKLLLRQRDADAAGAKLAGRAQHQRAPAAADVEQRLAGLQAQLGQDVVDLFLLRFRQRLVAVLEIGARINHPRVQPFGIERVRHVVVVLNGRAVLRARVAHGVGHAVRHAAKPAAASGLLVGIGLGQAPGDVDDVLRLAVDVDMAFDVGAAQVVKRGRQQRGHAAGVAHVHGHARLVKLAQGQRAAALPANQQRHVHALAQALGPRRQRGIGLLGGGRQSHRWRLHRQAVRMKPTGAPARLRASVPEAQIYHVCLKLARCRA